MKCQVCSNAKLYKFLSLGNHPPPDFFPTKNQIKQEKLYPLDVYLCENCGLVQSMDVVDPNILFGEGYSFTTGTTNALVRNFRSLVSMLVKRFNLTPKNLVIDIGSNDGTLLEGYKAYNVRILGVEPSSVAKIAMEKGIPTIKEFFNKELAEKILKKHGKTKIITATNVFPHVTDLFSFVEGVKLLLDNKGVFIIEFNYLLDLITKTQYDSIYLEHLRYYSLKPLIHLFDLFGMSVFDIERISTHGGSLRVFICKKGDYSISKSVVDMLDLEKKHKLYSKITFNEFTKRVIKNKKKLKKIVTDIKAQGKRIVGIGAPAKSSTLLNYCQIGPDVLDYIAERNDSLKIGKYMPGTHIKIVDELRIFEEQPEYALLLSWNIKNDLIPKFREKGFKGKFIIPIPTPTVE